MPAGLSMCVCLSVCVCLAVRLCVCLCVSSCVCGRLKLVHASRSDITAMRVTYPDQRWSVARNTDTAPTDAYGTMEFLGGPHPTKAQVPLS